MPVSYTNRKGVTYTLYRGQTRTGKPRYYFGRHDQSQGEPVTELPSGYTISESVNGVVSLVKDRPALIQPEEVAAVEAAVHQHPQARRYRVAVKGNRIEVYEQVGPDYNAVVSGLHIPGLSRNCGPWRSATRTLRQCCVSSSSIRHDGCSARSGCPPWEVSTTGWNWGRQDPWQSWPRRSFPLWAPSSSLNSGETATDQARK